MAKIALGLLLLAVITGCERRTVVTIEGSPPTFILKGSGRLAEVIVYSPEQELIAKSDPFDDRYALWEIAPERDGEQSAARVEELHSITYGVLPRGYKQIKPKSGPPPVLGPGERYRYWFVTVNAPHAAGYFEIRDGKAVIVDGP
ncbi:MAG: hypothetical protein ND895_23860 [Pyrinomonadaceae bacterium]|nr:hypothetical protein [Pyrinomonadaceae bacterium]